MKILDKPSQILNVRNTTSQCHSLQVHQTKTKYPNQNTKYAKQDTKYAKQNTKYAKQNTKYAKQNTNYTKQNTRYAKQKPSMSNKSPSMSICIPKYYAVFRETIFVANLPTFLRTFYRPKNMVAYNT